MNAADWILAAESSGHARRFGIEALPVSIGAADADIRVAGVSGVVQIGLLDGVFFVQPGRSTRNLRVDGEPVSGSRRLADGDVIALDSARLTCALKDGRLTLAIEAVVTAGDTSPPDLEEIARTGVRKDDIAITPITFRPAGSGSGASRRGPSPATLAVAAGFGVLAVLAWFAFTARSVALSIEPAPDSVSLPGTLFKLRLGDRFLLRSGSHRVVAELPGYYPLDTEIQVGLSPDQSFRLTLTKLPGLVTISTDPEAGAEVRADGESIGRTPLTDVEITPGLHRLEFSAERYLPQIVELDVTGMGEHQGLVATLTPNWAPVSFSTEPAGAEVLVDGESSGATPVTLELEAGERKLELRLRGYNAWRNSIVVSAAQPLTLPPVKLTQADGRVELVSRPGEASVSVDDEFRGHTPLSLRLRPGPAHRITLSKPGYETETVELSVAADSGRTLEVELKAQYGEIAIRSEPPSAEIWVDGRREGFTPSTLMLTALDHEIEVRMAGYAAKTMQVTPRPGFPLALDLELEALDETSGSGYAPVIRTGIGQELRLVPAGQFTMGTSRRDPDRRSNEVLREVKLSRAFYLGAREVSNDEFRAFFKDHDSGEFAGLSLNGGAQPVVRVTWEEAAQFLNWLSIQDALQPVYEDRLGEWAAVRPLRNGYRLPTEAEWAWAARFASREDALVYPWGNKLPPPDRSGNYADVSAAGILPTTLVTYNDGFEVTAPTGSFEPNAVGIEDLGGNVAEWVQDYYAVETEPEGGAAADPLGPQTGRFRVVRGSSWRSATVAELRLASRQPGSEAREDIGFRIARSLE